ncbi:MAG: 16S rRNA (uracil(1498)-N(3))-methyltransferase [Nitrospirae bacterium]|nr:16S rRNA (uracil(1498)-N(3))-methyltransferase [Nitrospirota bacterium]
MTRLFLDRSIQKERVIHLTGEKAHYISAVLRCKIHDPLIVTDSTGTAYSAQISAITKKLAAIEILEPFNQDNESPLDIVLVQGLLKGEKMDLVIQKATELGVKEIAPVVTERSQVRETRKLQRWQKIAEEASRQCGRNMIPLIHEPAAYEAALAGQDRGRGIICWEKGQAPFSAAADAFKGEKKIVLCIGPEGGFSEKEVKTAKGCGLTIASLGRRILRAETAALTAVALAQYVLGDLSDSNSTPAN